MKRRKLFALAASCLLGTTGIVLGGLTSCGGSETIEDYIQITGGNVTVGTGQTVTLNLVDQDGHDVSGATWTSNLVNVATVNSGVVTTVNEGTAVISATYNGLTASTTITVSNPVDMSKAASGLKNLKRDDYATNAESGEINNDLLGLQEKYAMEEFLTGIPLVADSTYQMFSDRVTLPVDEYQSLMGFGTPTYVQINGTLSGLASSDPYKNYYRLGTSEDPQEIFAADTDMSSADTLSGHITTPLWSYKFNANKNGGELYGVTAKDLLPIAMNADESGSATTFRIHVRTESDGFYYTYAGKRKLTGFEAAGTIGNGLTLYKKGVKVEDYLTVLKLALTQSNGLYRGGEMAGDQYTQLLKGAQEYYQATANTKTSYDESLWAQVGATTGTDEQGAYVEFTTANKFTVSSFRDSFQGLPYYSPLPLSNVEEIGVSTYGKFSSNREYTIVDNTISTGPYTLINWVTDKEITFAKNSVYTKLSEESEMYNHEGIDYTVYTGAKTNPELIFNEFIANKLDTTTIPATQLEGYKNDPRSKEVPDEGTWKLNVNALDQKTWEKLFGVNGTVVAHTPENYWDVKPIMSNKSFLKGLYFGTDRTAIAEATGYTPTQNYFSSVYMGYTYHEDGTRIKWNDTPQHQANLADWYPESNGFNEAAATTYFKRALDEEIAKGNYARNTGTQPITISLIAKWPTQASITQYGEPFAASVERIANAAWKSYNYALDIVNEVAGATTDDCYNALKTGEFDLGMGAITGYALDPLGLTQIFCSDNRSGFTLNWGPDTSVVDKRLEFDGEYYSFNGLYTAAYGGGIFSQGNAIEPVSLDVSDGVKESDKVVYTLTLRAIEGAGIETIKIKELQIFSPDDNSTFYYVENGYDEDSSNDVDLGEGLEVKLTAEILNSYTTASGKVGIYVSFDIVTSQGTLSDQYFQFTVTK